VRGPLQYYRITRRAATPLHQQQRGARVTLVMESDAPHPCGLKQVVELLDHVPCLGWCARSIREEQVHLRPLGSGPQLLCDLMPPVF